VTWAAIGMEEVGRLTGTGYLLRSVLAGSPFIADLRVQWIRLARAKKSTMPLVVHLVGKRDELVSREDSLDLNAAEGVIFKTLPAVNHREISQQLFLTENGQQALSEVGHAIQEALVLNRPQFPAGWADPVTRTQDEAVTRVVYIMHGIRDEGDWTDVIENRILRLLGGDIQTIKIPPVRYNRFAMLPFLLYWDRQRNVRRFMDQYTEDLARYPNLKTVDYFGHSNGTYIVASALQQYPVLEVRNVLFAGSVVPSHYSWARPLAERRVQQVRNVVADADWVVGLFPQVFELFSQHVLREEHSGFGLFDVGAAGFRGFKEANDGGSVKDIRFVAGQHSAAIEVVGTEPLAVRKLEAIATFMATGDDTQLSVFDMTKTRDPYVYFLSNFSWAVWLIIVLAIAGFGWLAASRSPLILGGYVALLLVVLFTV
jgi:pimeloyl-ACP methyl ester carboxylesterase